MLTQATAQSLMGIVPEKRPATIVLTPDSNPTTINVFSAWIKPLTVRLTKDGGLNLQGDETIIKIPDRELNSVSHGYELRPQDRITLAGTTYIVLSASLKTVRTVWECIVRKELT